MLHANAKLLIQCLAYLPCPSDERFLRIGKVSVTASDIRNVGKSPIWSTKSKFRKIYRHQWAYKNSQSFKDVNVTISAKGSSVSPASFLPNDLPTFYAVIGTFLLEFSLVLVFFSPLRTTQTNMGSNWLICVTPSLAALWLGRNKTKVFWHQSEARAAPTVWNWSVKTLSPGALSLVLDFSSPEFFLAFVTFSRPH